MKTLLTIALLMSAVPALGAGKPFPQLDLGRPFPELKLPLATDPDQSASIMEYRGRKLMLHLFASW